MGIHVTLTASEHEPISQTGKPRRGRGSTALSCHSDRVAPARPSPPLTGPQQDDLVVQGQLGEVRDALGPLHQREELLVGRLADVGDGVVGLGEEARGEGRQRPRPPRPLRPAQPRTPPEDATSTAPEPVPAPRQPDLADVMGGRVLRWEGALEGLPLGGG